MYFQLDFQTPPGFDRTRNAVIGNKDFKLTYLEEAYTTEHWLVRIYRWVAGRGLMVGRNVEAAAYAITQIYGQHVISSPIYFSSV